MGGKSKHAKMGPGTSSSSKKAPEIVKAGSEAIQTSAGAFGNASAKELAELQSQIDNLTQQVAQLTEQRAEGSTDAGIQNKRQGHGISSSNDETSYAKHHHIRRGSSKDEDATVSNDSNNPSSCDEDNTVNDHQRPSTVIKKRIDNITTKSYLSAAGGNIDINTNNEGYRTDGVLRHFLQCSEYIPFLSSSDVKLAGADQVLAPLHPNDRFRITILDSSYKNAAAVLANSSHTNLKKLMSASEQTFMYLRNPLKTIIVFEGLNHCKYSHAATTNLTILSEKSRIPQPNLVSNEQEEVTEPTLLVQMKNDTVRRPKNTFLVRKANYRDFTTVNMNNGEFMVLPDEHRKELNTMPEQLVTEDNVTGCYITTKILSKEERFDLAIQLRNKFKIHTFISGFGILAKPTSSQNIDDDFIRKQLFTMSTVRSAILCKDRVEESMTYPSQNLAKYNNGETRC